MEREREREMGEWLQMKLFGLRRSSKWGHTCNQKSNVLKNLKTELMFTSITTIDT